MKKYIFVILFSFLCFLIFISTTHAISPTPEKDKTLEIQNQLINDIASRVAQLKLVEKRGTIGKVTDATNTQITLSDLKNNIRFIDVDELTKFSNPDESGSFGISDIAKNSTIGVLGLYNKDSRRILARFVSVTTVPFIIHGGVSEIDDQNYTLNIITDDKKQIAADVETSTKTYSYTKSDGLVKSGFSKIKANYTIIIGKLSKADANKMTATRIISFPEIPLSPKIKSVSEQK